MYVCMYVMYGSMYVMYVCMYVIDSSNRGESMTPRPCLVLRQLGMDELAKHF